MTMRGFALGFFSLVLTFGFVPEVMAATGNGNGLATPKEKLRVYAIDCTITETTPNGNRRVLALPKMTIDERQEGRFESGGEVTLPDARKAKFGVSVHVTVTTDPGDEVRVDSSIESKVPGSKHESDITLTTRNVHTIRKLRLGQVGRTLVDADDHGAVGLCLEVKVLEVADETTCSPPRPVDHRGKTTKP
jgi:hypothetical protein